MIKFFGEPLKEIKGALSGKIIFRFDHKGEYFTDDPKIIERAIGHFDHAEVKIESIGERVEKTFTVPPLTITTQDAPKEEPKKETKIQCQYCAEVFTDYLARSRHTKRMHSSDV